MWQSWDFELGILKRTWNVWILTALGKEDEGDTWALTLPYSQWVTHYTQVEFVLLFKSSSRLSPSEKVTHSSFLYFFLSTHCFELLQYSQGEPNEFILHIGHLPLLGLGAPDGHRQGFHGVIP